jgi:hypothetical protein
MRKATGAADVASAGLQGMWFISFRCGAVNPVRRHLWGSRKPVLEMNANWSGCVFPASDFTKAPF